MYIKTKAYICIEVEDDKTDFVKVQKSNRANVRVKFFGDKLLRND